VALLRFVPLLCGACVGLGCYNQREPFAPSEHVSARVDSGQIAASYDVLADGRVVGETKVWSAGAFRHNGRTLVHVAFALEGNESDIELDLDSVRLEYVDAGDRPFSVPAPDSVYGSALTRAGAESEVDFYFEVPPDVKPQELDAFRVHWSVLSGGERYREHTPFVELRSRYRSTYVFYAPFGATYPKSGQPIDPPESFPHPSPDPSRN
jgi:hypothetical protein